MEVSPRLIEGKCMWQCYSDVRLGVVGLVDDDNAVWAVKETDPGLMALALVGRLPDAARPEWPSPGMLDRSFSPDGSLLVFPADGGVAAWGIAGSHRWSLPGAAGAVFDQSGMVWAWGYPGDGKIDVALLNPITGTAVASAVLDDPWQADNAWLEIGPTPLQACVVICEGQGGQLTAALTLDGGDLVVSPALPSSWLPLAWSPDASLVLAESDLDDGLGVWSVAAEEWIARRDEWPIMEGGDPDDHADLRRPGNAGFFLPDDRIVFQQDYTNRWLIADPATLTVVDELLIAGYPLRPERDTYPSWGSDELSSDINSILPCGDLLITHTRLTQDDASILVCRASDLG